MKIQQIQPGTTFEAKQRFLNQSQYFNLKMLLGRMTSESNAEFSEFRFSHKCLQSIKIEKNARFSDESFLSKPSYKMMGQSTLEMGRTSLTFNNETGEIIKHKKPFYLPWSRVIKKAEQVMQLANDNFNNKKIVEKMFIIFEGFTPKGFNRLQEAINNVNKKGKSKPGKKVNK